jgi:hypothetical protein
MQNCGLATQGELWNFANLRFAFIKVTRAMTARMLRKGKMSSKVRFFASGGWGD